ncbi:2-keto-4-pentenoate hydratase [Klenkia taihuensis]|uniref:2-keto-4-pentenoate hydratase n=1 Tax=Klenkia taihuensis TaxID=1225127 RepID=A0A1I1U8H0_9ACTN|nr:2-keto-4-pentenoate hydratase [Klenkia taihuensis]SFD65033.1 2-keto-4-pentenoate hydratase [Klenkia taihuensis]
MYVASIAQELADAARDAVPVAPLSERFPQLTLDDAYAVQAALVAGWTAGGAEVVGHKVGLTSSAMQQQLGVDSPDSGVLTDRMVFGDGAVLDAGGLVAPRVEAELAVVLGRDLAPGASRDEVVAAVDSVVIALEVIDSRIRDWRISLLDTVADNASSAAAVLGWPVPLGEAGDLRTVGITLHRNGVVVATGAGAAILGNPLYALVWLAGQEHAPPLRAGQVVLLGAVHAAVPLGAGDVVTATASGLGSVTATIGGRP